MKKLPLKTFAVVSALALTACAAPDTISTTPDDTPRESCVAGYVETSPGKGTLDIFFPTEFSPDVQSIENVSIEVAEEVSIQIGTC